ncbi:hypothetical protein RchiOBHm_Chr5g0051881 [Rosa chinensis]|uniref:BSD domain-containing protein n=1 Tax=Rosa chinensis TaxID=74649 RepID=A0A2P6QFH5_ROSCH|nr:hypothetical protein RchiOBHm_Chr5g0051881 [Rosa chinensis]
MFSIVLHRFYHFFLLVLILCSSGKNMSCSHFTLDNSFLKTAISRATSRNDWMTIRDALEVSAEMFKKDGNNVSDYVQRHLISLSIWEELRFWESYFDCLMERSSNKPLHELEKSNLEDILIKRPAEECLVLVAASFSMTASLRSTNYASLVTDQLSLVELHMVLYFFSIYTFPGTS